MRLLKLGRPENRFDRLSYRITNMLVTAITQSSNLKSLTAKDPAALGHTLMLWGLIIFGLGCVIFIGFGVGFGLFSVYTGSAFEKAFFSVLDIVAAVVILAIIYVIIKRYIVRPERLNRKETPEEKVTQALLLTVMMSLMLLYYGIEGFGYAANGVTGTWPLIGTAFANFLVSTDISQERLAAVFQTLWWVNYALLLCAVIYAPRSKHLHPLTSFFNLTFQDLTPKGSLKLIDLKDTTKVGASKLQDFTWKQLLDGYACTWCGRCHVVCPAQVSGKPLSPRELILGMKESLLHDGPGILKGKNPEKALIGGVISEDAIWSCTTCRACQEVCPVSNEHIDKIVDMRRYLQMVATTETGRDSLKNLRVRGNPWRGTMFARTDWAEGMNVKVVGEDNSIDVLYWVGCTEALEDRSLKVAQSVAKLMQQAGVNFGILGEEEMCCGDPARRMGAEHIFQMLATNNIQLMQSYNVKKIVTACPHCFNTLKKEYPQLGGNFEVVHHTQFIAELIREKKLKIKNLPDTVVTYQDPCYLGRYNDVFQAPRQILSDIPGAKLVEMEKNRKDGFCCGGGGGRMWLEEKIGSRINEMRLGQITETEAQVVATACPFCLQMFEDAAKAKEVEGQIKVRDIAELVAEQLETPGKPVNSDGQEKVE